MMRLGLNGRRYFCAKRKKVFYTHPHLGESSLHPAAFDGSNKSRAEAALKKVAEVEDEAVLIIRLKWVRLRSRRKKMMMRLLR